jgi:hypothetical protein
MIKLIPFKFVPILKLARFFWEENGNKKTLWADDRQGNLK